VVGSCVDQWDQRAVGGAVADASGGAVGSKTHVPAERVAVGKKPLPSLPLLLTAKQKNKKKRRGGAERAVGRAHSLYGAGCMLFEVADFTGALVPLQKALVLYERAHGNGSTEVAPCCTMIGRCHAWTDGRYSTSI
jgi:hypothetical protein